MRVRSARFVDATGSFAALDASARHLLRKRGGDAGDLHVIYVAADRVWLERNGALCQAHVFGRVSRAAPGVPETTAAGIAQTALEKEIAGRVARTGPNERQIDRSAVDRLIKAQAELTKTPLVPDKEDDRKKRRKSADRHERPAAQQPAIAPGPARARFRADVLPSSRWRILRGGVQPTRTCLPRRSK